MLIVTGSDDAVFAAELAVRLSIGRARYVRERQLRDGASKLLRLHELVLCIPDGCYLCLFDDRSSARFATRAVAMRDAREWPRCVAVIYGTQSEVENNKYMVSKRVFLAAHTRRLILTPTGYMLTHNSLPMYILRGWNGPRASDWAPLFFFLLSSARRCRRFLAEVCVCGVSNVDGRLWQAEFQIVAVTTSQRFCTGPLPPERELIEPYLIENTHVERVVGDEEEDIFENPHSLSLNVSEFVSSLVGEMTGP